MIWFDVYDGTLTTGTFELEHSVTGGDGGFQVQANRDASAIEIVRDQIVPYILNPSRPWAADVTGCALEVVKIATRLSIRLTFSGPNPTFSYTFADSEWAICTGAPSLGGGGTVLQFDPPSLGGDLACDLGTINWLRRDNQEGVKCRAGSWRMEHPSLVCRRPSIQAYLSPAENYTLGRSLESASDPRKAYVYDEGSATWRRVVVGQITQEIMEDDWTQIPTTFEVLGEV